MFFELEPANGISKDKQINGSKCNTTSGFNKSVTLNRI